MRDLRHIGRLSLRDLMHEWRVTFCLIISVATVLTPLLILFGLKAGLITAMTDRLIKDPRNLELRPSGSGTYMPDWFENLTKLPETGFVLPRTRSLATSVGLVNPATSAFVKAELVPTSLGDPILEEKAPAADGITLSARAADALKVAQGDVINIVIGRVRDKKRERATHQVTISAILPPARFVRAGGFVELPLLTAIEDYRDGIAAPLLQAEGRPGPPGPRSYASFRLFAATLDDVPALQQHLAEQGIDLRSRANDIAMLQALDRNLNAIFWTLAGIAAIGAFISLGSSLWANIERKIRDLATLRLIGFPGLGLGMFPVFQSLVICLLGSVLAAVLSLAIQGFINTMFADSVQSDEVVSRISVLHLLIATAAALGFGLIASLLGGFRAASIEPGESLRDV